VTMRRKRKSANGRDTPMRVRKHLTLTRPLYASGLISPHSYIVCLQILPYSTSAGIHIENRKLIA
jgi:hypothetical protein